jgi:hypothetical protein
MPRTPPQPAKQRNRGPSRFKRSEATRLLQGTIDAKLPVRGIEVDAVTGDLRVLVGQPGEAPAETVKDLIK